MTRDSFHQLADYTICDGYDQCVYWHVGIYNVHYHISPFYYGRCSRLPGNYEQHVITFLLKHH